MPSKSRANPSAPRGRGWKDPDRILLILAHEWAEKTKTRIRLNIYIVLMRFTASESSDVFKGRRADHFNNSDPSEKRPAGGVTAQWNEIFAAHKHIHDYQRGIGVGSTGGEDWWLLTKAEQAAKLPKNQVLLKNDPLIVVAGNF